LSYGDFSAPRNPSRFGVSKIANAPIARGQNAGTSPILWWQLKGELLEHSHSSF
jgi:hypothetical protein